MEKKALADFQEYNDKTFAKRVVFKKEDSVVFLLNFNPGQELPPHKHPGTHVFLHVLEGEGTLVSNDENMSVSTGDLICVDGDDMFAIKNTSTGQLSLHVVLSKIPDARYAQNI